MSVPALRFKEFSGDWEVKKLGDLCSTFKSGSGITSEHISNYGSYPVYGGNGLRGYTDSFTHDGFYLLIGRQGALCGNINRSFGKAYISEHAIAVCANETSNTEWLSQKLNLLNLNRLSESSAQPGLAVNKLIKLEFETPSLPEQTKIANFLTAVDEKITLLTQKATLLSQYKKGVMQQIFSQELRFKDDDGQEYPEWEEKRLGDISVLITKGTTPKRFSYEGINFIKIECFDGNLILKEKCAFIEDVTHQTELKRSILFDGDILFAIAGSIGKCNIVTADILPANTNQALAIVRLKENENRKYIYHLLSSYKMQKYIGDNISVGAQPNLNLEQMGNFNINYPSLPEQTKIANFLTAIDDKITNNKNQLDAVKQYKQGLLQQMFV